MSGRLLDYDGQGDVMPADPWDVLDEEALALRLAKGDSDALRTLLQIYGGRIKNCLRRRYGDVLQEQEIETVLNSALIKAWRHAGSIDLGRGSLGGWFLRIAQRCAIDLLAGHVNRREDLLRVDPEDPSPSEEDEELDARTRQRLQDLDEVIERLGRVQKAIIRADLALGGQADNRRLAAQLGTTLNSIYVSRNKAHDAIRKAMQERGHYGDQPGDQK